MPLAPIFGCWAVQLRASLALLSCHGLLSVLTHAVFQAELSFYSMSFLHMQGEDVLEDVREIIIEQLGKPADEVRPTLIQSRHIVGY